MYRPSSCSVTSEWNTIKSPSIWTNEPSLLKQKQSFSNIGQTLHFYLTIFLKKHVILQLACCSKHLPELSLLKSWIRGWKEMRFDFALFDLAISWLTPTSTVCLCCVIVNPSASDKVTNLQIWTTNISLKGLSGRTPALSQILHGIKLIEFILSGKKKKNKKKIITLSASDPLNGFDIEFCVRRWQYGTRHLLQMRL